MENQENNREERDEKIAPAELRFSRKEESGEKSAGGAEKEKSPLRLKVENFLYYYKWQTLAALFLVFVVVICTLQMCSKVSVDGYLLYAGSRDVGKVAQNGDVSELETCLSSFRLYVEDLDGDGKKTVNFETLYLLSPDEKAAIQKKLAEGGHLYELNETQQVENAEALSDHLLAGDVYLCLLSEYWLDVYANYFQDLSAYAAGTGCELTDSGLGAYLSSTPLGKRAGFDRFPEDTVVCLRKMSAIGGKRSERDFENAKDVLCKILGGKEE